MKGRNRTKERRENLAPALSAQVPPLAAAGGAQAEGGGGSDNANSSSSSPFDALSNSTDDASSAGSRDVKTHIRMHSSSQPQQVVSFYDHVADPLSMTLGQAQAQIQFAHNNSCLLYTSDAADE